MASLAPLPEQISEKPVPRDTKTNFDNEAYGTEEVPSETEKPGSENESQQYQGGVERARGITAAWSKKTMWLMFVLSVLAPDDHGTTEKKILTETDS